MSGLAPGGGGAMAGGAAAGRSGSGGGMPVGTGAAGTGLGAEHHQLAEKEGARPETWPVQAAEPARRQRLMLPAIEGECPSSWRMAHDHGAARRHRDRGRPPGKGGPLLFYWHGTATVRRRSPSVVARGSVTQTTSSGWAASSRRSTARRRARARTAPVPQRTTKRDFEAADRIAACAVRDHGIDPRRIYTTGCSAGGLQSGCMAMMRSSYIAAAAPNSGGIVGRPRWQDMGKPAIFSMHGGPGDMVIVTFSQTSMALNSAVSTQGGFVVNCNHMGGHCRRPRRSRAPRGAS